MHDDDDQVLLHDLDDDNAAALEDVVPNEDDDDGDEDYLIDSNVEAQQQQQQLADVDDASLSHLLIKPENSDDESGTEEDRIEFMSLLESFCKQHALDFKPPKFYGEPLNCLKLYRAVTRLGGYDRVTSSKLWRQVGETFNPPKTCTTVSWTFRIFYEKALLEYEKHQCQTGQLLFPDPVTVESQIIGYITPGPGRARRDSAARAMQGWHTHRGYDYGEDKNQNLTVKREKHLKSIGISPSLIRQKRASNMEYAHNEADRQLAVTVVDIGTAADWVKINVRETKDCYEVYALVPGLLREEVRVQSDPVGRLVITGQPEQLENPWGITPFTKVVNLPGRIDPHQTSAVVSLHGRLFVRVPFEQ